VPSFLIILGAALVDRGEAKPGLFSFLGNASYSIYLTHAFATLAFSVLLQKLALLRMIPADPLIVCVTVATILATSLSYLVVEKPLVRLVSRAKPTV
jgi:peptidoglycan/LPS O-acetylase OafA/YrhL